MKLPKALVFMLVIAMVALPTAVFANHVFGDVATDAFYHEDVSEIYEARVTVGCQADPPLYCPERATNRGEMASFLARGMGRVGFSGVGEFVPLTGTDAGTADAINSVTIEAGGAESGGTANVKLDALYVVEETDVDSCTTEDPTVTDGCEVTLELRDQAGNASGQSSSTLVATVETTFPESQAGSVTWVVPVDTATTHQFTLYAWLSNGTGTVQARGDISALYVPFSTEQPTP